MIVLELISIVGSTVVLAIVSYGSYKLGRWVERQKH
jgi:hypothetical protein